MSRSGYCDDIDNWASIRWRGAVASAIRGKRGQAFLRELLAALDALPEPKLIEGELVTSEGCCAMGAVALSRGLDTSDVDPYDTSQVAHTFGIAEALAAEIEFMNDDGWWNVNTPEQRFIKVREWVVGLIKVEVSNETKTI